MHQASQLDLNGRIAGTVSRLPPAVALFPYRSAHKPPGGVCPALCRLSFSISPAIAPVQLMSRCSEQWSPNFDPKCEAFCFPDQRKITSSLQTDKPFQTGNRGNTSVTSARKVFQLSKHHTFSLKYARSKKTRSNYIPISSLLYFPCLSFTMSEA